MNAVVERHIFTPPLLHLVPMRSLAPCSKVREIPLCFFGHKPETEMYIPWWFYTLAFHSEDRISVEVKRYMEFISANP